MEDGAYGRDRWLRNTHKIKSIRNFIRCKNRTAESARGFAPFLRAILILVQSKQEMSDEARLYGCQCHDALAAGGG
jgi:hypothetical protein